MGHNERQETEMTVAITLTTNITKDQYDEIWSRIRAAQADHPRGRRSHVAFEQDGVMRVVDVWDSKEDFEAFGQTILPIIAQVGGQVTPEIAPAHDFQID